MDFKKISKKIIKIALSGVLLIFIFFISFCCLYSSGEIDTSHYHSVQTECDKNTELLKAKTSNLDNINVETEQIKKDIEELTGQIENLKKEEIEASTPNVDNNGQTTESNSTTS